MLRKNRLYRIFKYGSSRKLRITWSSGPTEDSGSVFNARENGLHFYLFRDRLLKLFFFLILQARDVGFSFNFDKIIFQSYLKFEFYKAPVVLENLKFCLGIHIFGQIGLLPTKEKKNNHGVTRCYGIDIINICADCMFTMCISLITVLTLVKYFLKCIFQYFFFLWAIFGSRPICPRMYT